MAADSGSNYHSDYLYYMNESGNRSGAFLPTAAAVVSSALVSNGGSPSRSFSGGLGSSSGLGNSNSELDAYSEMEDLLYTENHPGRLCSLCNLSERSMLGQGDMVKYKVPSSVDIVVVIKDRRKALGIGALLDDSIDAAGGKSDARGSPKSMLSTAITSLNARRKGRKFTSGDINEPADELENVGFTEEPDHNLLFESSGM